MNIEKIRNIRQVCEKCLKLDASDLNLLLKSVGKDPIDSRFWHGEDYGHWAPTEVDRKELIYEVLEVMSAEQLRNFEMGLDTFLDASAMGEHFLSDDVIPLFLFGSHLDKHKKVVSEIGNRLLLLGVRLFIAHESIRPTADFQQEIRKSLSEVHGGLIFFHDDFGGSLWCDQEVGWLIGRKLPYFTLKFGKKPPHGFIAKDQALTVTERTTQEKVIQELVEWMSSDPVLSPRFIDSLLISISRSNLFSTTDSLWQHLRVQQDLSRRQIDYLLAATRENYQIHGAECRVGTYDDGRGSPYPKVIWNFVQSQAFFDASSEKSIQFRNRFPEVK